MLHCRILTVIILSTAISQSLVPIRSDAGQAAEEQLLIAGKTTMASQIEPGLPDQPIEA
jgi:hypothetical protein